MECVGVDRDRVRHLIEAMRDKFTPQEQIDAIFKMVERNDVDIVGIESFGFQGYLKFNLEKEMIRRDRLSPEEKQREGIKRCFFTIIELSHKGRSKEDRIAGLEPILRNKQMVFANKFMYTSVYDKEEHDGISQLIDELLRQTMQGNKSGHDDMGDCLAYFIDLDPWMVASEKETTHTKKEILDTPFLSQERIDMEDRARIVYQNSTIISSDLDEDNVDEVTAY